MELSVVGREIWSCLDRGLIYIFGEEMFAVWDYLRCISFLEEKFFEK